MLAIRGLEKYQRPVTIKKTKSYLEILKYQDFLKKCHIHLKLKNEYDIQATLVYLRGLLNLEKLSQIYYFNTNDNRELWSLMSYSQRQLLLHKDLEEMLADLAHFYQGDTLILMPFYTKICNQTLTLDYQSLIYKTMDISVLEEYHDPIELYGKDALIHGFCNFKWVASYSSLVYLYLEDWHAFYVFDEEKKAFVDRFVVQDKYTKKMKEDIDLEKIAYFYHENREKELIDYLYEYQWISSKVYKKICKKFLGG